ncbi:MAG: hypothetical protein ABIQ01_00715 [Pseudolysinimonas sp.]
MVSNPTAVLVVRCADKGKLIGRVYQDVDDSLRFIVLHVQIPSADPEGWYDQADHPDGRYAPSGGGEISVDITKSGSFSAGCGCKRRVAIVNSEVHRAVLTGKTELRLAHVSR